MAPDFVTQSVGLGLNEGVPFGSTEIDGQDGRVPTVFTVIDSEGGNVILGGGPGGIGPGGKSILKPKNWKSSHLMQKKKNHAVQGNLAPGPGGSDSSGCRRGSRKYPTALDEADSTPQVRVGFE